MATEIYRVKVEYRSYHSPRMLFETSKLIARLKDNQGFTGRSSPRTNPTLALLQNEPILPIIQELVDNPSGTRIFFKLDLVTSTYPYRRIYLYPTGLTDGLCTSDSQIITLRKGEQIGAIAYFESDHPTGLLIRRLA